MYLLNTETTIEWELLATATPPALSELAIVIMDPSGGTEYLDTPIAPEDYTAPTAETNGTALYKITPSLEGLYRIRLVTGSAASYRILSKVEMMVFDNTTVTSPYNESVGQPFPYDVNFYVQGYTVIGEISGIYIASRPIVFQQDAPGSKAKAMEYPHFSDTVFNILKNDDLLVGTILFPATEKQGTISMVPTTLLTGDTLSLVTTSSADDQIRDISVNLVGCCTVVPCTVF